MLAQRGQIALVQEKWELDIYLKHPSSSVMATNSYLNLHEAKQSYLRARCQPKATSRRSLSSWNGTLPRAPSQKADAEGTPWVLE